MTNETATSGTDAVTTETVANDAVSNAAPVVPTTTATSCCSESHGHDHSHGAAAFPVAAVSLPVAGDCCSSQSSCSTTHAAGAESVDLDDAALIDALREVIDPELMINIVDLGLVYSINHTDRKVNVEMTLTSPACPAGPQIIMQSKMALEKVPGVDVAEIKLTMSPPWSPARMTDEARDQLGIF